MGGEREKGGRSQSECQMNNGFKIKNKKVSETHHPGGKPTKTNRRDRM